MLMIGDVEMKERWSGIFWNEEIRRKCEVVDIAG